MTAQPRTSPTTPPGARARAGGMPWTEILGLGLGGVALAAAGCELSVTGAPCPCGPGWICLEADEPDHEPVCVRPYCVFWTYEQRAAGIDVELGPDLVVVTGYTDAVPPGSDILVTASGTLDIFSDNHRVFVEPYGIVRDLGDDNQIYLRDQARYLAGGGERNLVFHEPDAVYPLDDPEVILEEQPAIDFVGLVEVPFADSFREIADEAIDPRQGGIDDYVVRNGARLYLPHARANNIFVERRGQVFSIDHSTVAYLQSEALFDAESKRQVIHYVSGATVANGDDCLLIEHASLELDVCTM